MQVLVTYYSRTGNTKKLAEHVADGVREVEGITCVLKAVGMLTREDFLSSDGIIAGSPVYFGVMAAELKAVFDEFVDLRAKMGDKVGAAFASSGDMSGGKETTVLSILQCMLIYGMIVIGDPLDATGHYGVTCVGKPNEVTARNARKLGNRVARLCMTLKRE